MTIAQLAAAYHRAVHAAQLASIDGEAEAQLTVPVSNLLSGLAAIAGLGGLTLVRETRLQGSRPDFAALLTIGRTTLQKGFVELKAPDVSVDASRWTGRNARQWQRMSEAAEILLVCNGREAQLYRGTEPAGLPASLPYDGAEGWSETELVNVLRRFIDARVTPIVSVAELSRRLALKTRDLRDAIEWLIDDRQQGPASVAAREGHRSWQHHISPTATVRDFADGVSQVIAYGMVLAALGQNSADSNSDGHITVAEARAAIRETSPVLAAAFAPLIDRRHLADALRIELGALETLVSAINVVRVNASADRRGDPWLYFYEDFLAVYDPDERRQAGVYYTPVAVVRAMVAMTGHLLTERFGRRLGFADPDVVTLDPATGTGTFPLAIIDRAVARLTQLRGEAGPAQAAANLGANLFAFELLPGAYSVAHLRLSQRLSHLSGGATRAAQVILTDTLESPLTPPDYGSMFGDAQTLAEEQERASRIKLNQRVTVVIGNPPYRRVERDIEGRGSGGWVLNGAVPGRNNEQSLFADILDVARANTIFSHHASLYNLYVYFWRWAFWKAFEAHESGPGIVAFITGSSWLTGPGFVGLRQMVRELGDEAWVIDLGGDNRGANPEENIFAIETPVAIVLVARDGDTRREAPARVHYRRVGGSAEAKLAAMEALARADDPLGGEWQDAPDGRMDPLQPSTGDAAWEAMPALIDIFPWQQPGCMFNRAWPISPDAEALARRWGHFVAAPRDDKPDLFVTAATGRKVDTRVGDLRKLIDLESGDEPQPIRRYGYRSFDRQWTFHDPRLAALDRPALWQCQSDRQIYLTSLLTGHVGEGPALTLSCYVPDKHFFRGSFGGKDIIPLWRNAEATEPNLTAGLADALAVAIDIAPPTVEDIAAYCYALLSASAYHAHFAEALRTPGLRVPITRSADLWDEAVDAGRELIWMHSFAERMRDIDLGRGAHLSLVSGIGWARAVTAMPETSADIGYDADTRLLTIGNGQVTGVRADVWEYAVSGMPVLRKWLGYRTRRGTGRAASSTNPLDRIRPETWPDAWNDELLDLIRLLTITLDRQAGLADLLRRVCEGALVLADELPVPTARERAAPGAAGSLL